MLPTPKSELNAIVSKPDDLLGDTLELLLRILSVEDHHVLHSLTGFDAPTGRYLEPPWQIYVRCLTLRFSFYVKELKLNEWVTSRTYTISLARAKYKRSMASFIWAWSHERLYLIHVERNLVVFQTLPSLGSEPIRNIAHLWNARTDKTECSLR